MTRPDAAGPGRDDDEFALMLRASDLAMDRRQVWRLWALRGLIWFWVVFGLSLCGGAALLDMLGPPEYPTGLSAGTPA